MSKYTNRHRRDIQFQVGDKVFLKLRPYRQQSVTARFNTKLAARYFGPFEVIGKVGAVAYKLLLPSTSRIHPVFHVSQLKRVVGEHRTVTELPDQLQDVGEPIAEPAAILQTRIVQRGDDQVKQLLVQWAGRSVEESSWVDEADFVGQFPYYSLEDKAVNSGGSIVRNEPKPFLVYTRRPKHAADSDCDPRKQGNVASNHKGTAVKFQL